MSALFGLTRFVSVDKKFNIRLSVVNGVVFFFIFNNSETNRKMVYKMPLWRSALYVLTNRLKKVINTKAKCSFSVHMTKENDGSKITDTVTVGRDDSLMIYLEVKNSKSNKPIRFYLLVSNGLQISDAELNDTKRTEIGAELFLDLLTNQLNIAIIQTRADLSENAPNTPNNTNNKEEDEDIPF